MTWEDTTNYSQRDTERVPRKWSTEFGDVDLTIYRIRHPQYDDAWFWYSRDLDANGLELRSKDLEDAQREAILAIQVEISRRIERLQAALEVTSKEVTF